MSLRYLRFAQGIAFERLARVLSDILDLSAFRPDFWVSDRYGGQMGWEKNTRRESNTWLGSNEE